MITLASTLIKRPFELDQFDLMWKDFFGQNSFFDITNKVSHPTDIYETENGITIEIAAVGLDKNDIEIFAEGETLRIIYNKKQDSKEDRAIYRGIKRSSFDLAWRMATKFDLSKLEARLDRGLLILDIPQSEQKQTKRIEIK